MKNLITHVTGKSATLGTVVSAMGCVACFPALASIGAAIGLGVLAQWEGLFVRVLIPLFALVTLLANAFGWFNHRQWWRSALGMLGPVLVLLARYPFWHEGWRNAVLYAGLILMLGVAIWDLASPAARRCAARLHRLSPTARRVQP